MKEPEKIEFVDYDGRKVPKKDFRVFVYGANDQRRLCNSYDEYQKVIKSGEWVTSPDELKSQKGQRK